MEMTTNASNSTAAASAPHNHQQEAMVASSPSTNEEARNTEKAQATQPAGRSREPKTRPPQDAALCCPRCSSNSTKFCYYNNHNLNQPRHFCKNCRRYWTQGGTLRSIPFGGSCRRNNRASGSSSSSAASSTAAPSAEVVNAVNTRKMLTAATTSTMSMSSPTTGLFPNDMLPTCTPTGGSGLDLAMDEGQQGFLPFVPLSMSDDRAPATTGGSGLDLAMDEDQQGFLPFAPLPLFDDQAPELAPGASDDMPPTFLDMRTGGFSDGVSSSSSYDDGLAMGTGSNGMDMSFLLPGMGTSANDPMETQLVDVMNDVEGELQWANDVEGDLLWANDAEGELQWASYINDDGGYAEAPATRVEQQQENKKAAESSKNNDDGDGSSAYTNNGDGAKW